MVPDLAQTLAGLRKTLVEIVLPELRDPFAVEQLKTVVGAIGHLETVHEEIYPYEWTEHREYLRFLERLRSAFLPVATDVEGRALLAEVEERLPQGRSDARLPSLGTLRRENLWMKSAVSRIAVGPLRRAAGEAWAREVDAEFRELLRRQVARERAWIKQAGVDPRSGEARDLKALLFCTEEESDAQSTR